MLKIGRTCGLASTYYHGCRCDLCQDARRKYQRRVGYKPLKGKAKEHKAAYDKIAHKKKKNWRRELLNKLKNVPCVDCGESFPPYCMDFDHVPERGTREFYLSHWVSFSIGKEKLEAEIAKCDIVCAICHRIRTRMRQFPEEFIQPLQQSSVE